MRFIVIFLTLMVWTANAFAQIPDTNAGVQRNGSPTIGNVAKWTTALSISDAPIYSTQTILAEPQTIINGTSDPLEEAFGDKYSAFWVHGGSIPLLGVAAGSGSDGGGVFYFYWDSIATSGKQLLSIAGTGRDNNGTPLFEASPGQIGLFSCGPGDGYICSYWMVSTTDPLDGYDVINMRMFSNGRTAFTRRAQDLASIPSRLFVQPSTGENGIVVRRNPGATQDLVRIENESGECLCCWTSEGAHYGPNCDVTPVPSPTPTPTP